MYIEFWCVSLYDEHDPECARRHLMLVDIKEIPVHLRAPRIKNETRFAVVMYGGVSLAIYIYGVAKELYGMVRATARTKRITADGIGEYLFSVDDLSEAEKAYRSIGEAAETKFVVDILSGTSAGGINAIYLAKALVNGQSMDLLKNIWLEQGDIEKLINDRSSAIGGLRLQEPPASLLNSQRMYFYLLQALHEMDHGSRVKTQDGLSPFVEELNLCITATDIRGLTVKLPVSNAAVEENKYRNVFRFFYSTRDAAGWEVSADERADVTKEFSNDFIAGNNPFLAYVTRCKFSFPVAFEPMRLDDVKEVLKMREFNRYYAYKPEVWASFYKDYWEKGLEEFPKRSFGDGGYIDNKPFSYATEAVARRRADQPVDRKLIYIDPAPEHPELSQGRENRPDALENVMAAVMSIPRYEPIREDLEKVLERNRLIRRVNQVLSQVDFVPTLKRSGRKPWVSNALLWSSKYLDKELLNWYGIGYAAYHQIRVADVLENLKNAFLRAFNWDETGQQADDLALLLDYWRHAYYSIDPAMSETHISENDILFRFDTSWRQRRILFLQNIIDKFLLSLDLSGNDTKPNLKTQANELLKVSGIKKKITKFDQQKLHAELSRVKRELNDAYGLLRARGRAVRSRSLLSKPNKDSELGVYAEKLAELREMLEPSKNREATGHKLNILADQVRLNKAAGLEPSPELAAILEMIEQVTVALAGHLPNEQKKGYVCQTLILASGRVNDALGTKPKQADKKDLRTPMQKCLRYYYDAFEYFDMLTFPITYGTDVSESDEMEIIRISPEDAKSIVDESKGGKKLAGTTLMNFGAFFAREWRENDMMWGRLDGAENVINAVLPEGNERTELLKKVQIAILQEEMTSRDEAALYKARTVAEKAEREKQLLGKYSKRYELREGERETLLKTLERLSDPHKLYETFKEKYQVDRSFPPKETLSTGSRALQVTSLLLNGLSANHKSFSAPAKWLTSAAGIFAGITSVLLPNTLGNFLVAGYWVWLLYVFELLLIGTGLLVNSGGILQIGVVGFAITFVVHLILNFTSNVLDRRLGWTRLPILILAGVLGIAVLGFVTLLLYLGLLDLGLLTPPTGPIGEWITTLNH